MTYVLFETGSGKWIELIPGNARFHSSIENATKLIENQDIDSLLDAHDIDWYADTIEIQAVEKVGTFWQRVRKPFP